MRFEMLNMKDWEKLTVDERFEIYKNSLITEKKIEEMNIFLVSNRKTNNYIDKIKQTLKINKLVEELISSAVVLKVKI